MAGLLFLALVYLAVGQAAVNRSGAQAAADAAALAAAQNERDQLTAQWLKVLADPTKWQEIFDGKATFDVDPCGRARRLAAANDAVLNGCFPPGLLKYQADVKTNRSVGRSVVPGSEDFKSTASATAEIQPLCSKLPDEGADSKALPALACKGKIWHLKPDQTTGLPQPQDLFDVHLTDSPANDE
ncbi:pilus assembly protein TadG-related protein [Streptomyces sp. NPDC048191]|uniref:pilus assembly protein TadG-related protein n=1 Tax=Streptomyces sp. NPDC048191 TaxID=3155484 RepID=UPI0033D92D6F